MPVTIAVQPLTGTIGAQVTGVDPSSVLDDATVDAIRTAWHRHLVLGFRDVTITPEQQIAFARCFGDIQMPPVRTKFGEHAEVNVLDQTSGKGDADRWHNDNTYTATPAKGSVLHIVRVPSTGGDTCFANMYAAYDALSPGMRQLVDGLRAEHDVTRSLRRAIQRGQTNLDLAATQERLPPVVHPVVITHPETGRRALFVNAQSTERIVDIPDAESDAILAFLYEHVKSPEFHCRVRWDESTLVLLDNFAAQHSAVADYDERRVLHRVSIKGSRPV